MTHCYQRLGRKKKCSIFLPYNICCEHVCCLFVCLFVCRYVAAIPIFWAAAGHLEGRVRGNAESSCWPSATQSLPAGISSVLPHHHTATRHHTGRRWVGMSLLVGVGVVNDNFTLCRPFTI